MLIIYTRPMTISKLCFICLLLIASITSVLRADIVTLKDGTVYEGVIIKETRAQVVIEVSIANIKSTKTFPRYKVKSIEHKPVENAEDSKPENDDKDIDKPKTSTLRSTKRTARSTSKKSATSTSPKDNYIIVPILGMIGQETNADGLRRTLKLAARKKVKHIVFTIDSPGGYIYDAVETLKVLKEYDDALTYHAIVEEGAISASSVYVAAADDIFVRPGARVGGAVAYTKDNTSGSAKVDAKLNSIWAAQIAAHAESKGYPGDIFRAMVVLDAEIWLDTEGAVTDSRPAGKSTAKRIDSRSTILTIRASQMIQIGMAKEFTGGIGQLGDVIGATKWTEIKGIGERSMIKSAKERVALSEKMEFATKVFNDTTGEYEKHHPSTYSDYIRYVTRRDRTDLYNTENRLENSDLQDAESLNLWRSRSREAINDCDILIEALKEMAAVNKKAERIGALHLLMSSDFGDEKFKAVSNARSWLSLNLNRIPFNADGTLPAGPEI